MDSKFADLSTRRNFMKGLIAGGAALSSACSSLSGQALSRYTKLPSSVKSALDEAGIEDVRVVEDPKRSVAEPEEDQCQIRHYKYASVSAYIKDHTRLEIKTNLPKEIEREVTACLNEIVLLHEAGHCVDGKEMSLTDNPTQDKENQWEVNADLFARKHVNAKDLGVNQKSLDIAKKIDLHTRVIGSYTLLRPEEGIHHTGSSVKAKRAYSLPELAENRKMLKTVSDAISAVVWKERNTYSLSMATRTENDAGKNTHLKKGYIAASQLYKAGKFSGDKKVEERAKMFIDATEYVNKLSGGKLFSGMNQTVKLDLSGSDKVLSQKARTTPRKVSTSNTTPT